MPNDDESTTREEDESTTTLDRRTTFVLNRKTVKVCRIEVRTCDSLPLASSRNTFV